MKKKVLPVALMMLSLGVLISCGTPKETVAPQPKQSNEMIQGCKHINKKEYKKAKAILDTADKKGDSVAMKTIGLMYINGHGVKKDYAQAMRYFKKSYEYGNINAAYDVGVMYKNGEGVKVDREKARKYYLIAAKNDYGLAQFELAKMYAYDRNKEEFMHWGKRAQAHGYKFTR